MSRQSILILSVAACLWGLYSLYAVSVNALLKPGSQRDHSAQATTRTSDIFGAPAENVTLAQQFLTPVGHAWAAEAPCQFRTASVSVFAETLERVETEYGVNQVLFTPFAMIWKQQHDSEPLVAVSNSAVLTFSEPFDWKSASLGRVVSGSMNGDVEIRGPNGLRVLGKMFVFDEAAKLVFSDNKIEFAYEKHRGTAEGLQLELVPLSAPDSTGSPAIAGVRSLQLLNNVSMNLLYEDKHKVKEPILANVRSKGSFTYYFDSHIGTFEDDVVVERPTGPAEFDRLLCELLTLLFEPIPDGAAAGKDGPPIQPLAALNDRPSRAPPEPSLAPMDNFGINGDVEFRRLRAEGRVRVVSQNKNLRVGRMGELIYDQKLERLTLLDQKYVDVEQGPYRIRSPEIALQLDENGQVQTVDCRGAGVLESWEDGTLVVAADWLKHLRKYPDPNSDLDVIELSEQVSLRHPEQHTALGADEVLLWVTREEAKPKNSDAMPAAADSVLGDTKPKRLLARGNVAAVSPQMHLEKTDRLEVWFEEGNAPIVPVSALSSGPNTGAVTQIQDTEGPAKPQDEPVNVLADLVRVRMVLNEGVQEPHVAEVRTDGNVNITQKHSDGDPPLSATGDTVHVRNDGGDQQAITILGEPAHLRDRGMHLEGRTISFDRARSEAHVIGAGLLQLPIKNDIEGKPLSVPQRLDIRWNEQMAFDGQVVKFFGDVEAVTKDGQIRSHEMDVIFASRLDFSENAKQSKDVPVVGFVCKDNVDFSYHQYEENTIVDIRRGRVAHFSLDRMTGEMQAGGPGWLNIWQRGRARRAALTPTAIARANQPLVSNKAEWEYTRIDFDGKMSGNVNDRFTRLNERVKIVYGPVEQPVDIVDPNQLPKDAGQMECDVLEIKQVPLAENPYIKLKGMGNCNLEGHAFFAQADEVTFDGSKEMYVLTAALPRQATFWHQKRQGGDLSELNAQRFEFIPSRNQLKFDRATSVQGLQ